MLIVVLQNVHVIDKMSLMLGAFGSSHIQDFSVNFLLIITIPG